jgi:hypothetical protein
VPDPLPIDEPFDPFASAPAVPSGRETEDDIDFDQFLTSLSDAGFAYPGKADEPIEPITPEGSTDEPPADPPADPPPTADQAPPVPTVMLGDKEVPLEEARLLYELGRTLRDQGYQPPAPPAPTTGEQAPPQVDQTPVPPAPVAPVAETPPEWLDTEDPVQMGMWSEVQASRAEAAAARASVEQFNQQQQQSKVQQEILSGVALFKEQHPNVTEEEVNLLTSLAAPTVAAFVATSPSPIEGIAKAIRMAAIDFEPTRNRVLGLEQKTRQQKSTERKSKQGSLNPSGSGSAPRTSVPRSAPRTDRAATEEFAKELASAFGTNGRLN